MTTRNLHVLYKLDEHQFYPTLAATAGVSLVFFSKHGCGSCAKWKMLLTDYLKQKPDIHIFEIDAEQNMALVNEYELFHMPALFLFQDGEFHCELQSEAALPSLDAAIAHALSQPPQEAP